jgi:hypothetical protein
MSAYPRVLALSVKSRRFEKKLLGRPPLLHVCGSTILFDPRTVLDDEMLLSHLKSLLSET